LFSILMILSLRPKQEIFVAILSIMLTPITIVNMDRDVLLYSIEQGIEVKLTTLLRVAVLL